MIVHRLKSRAGQRLVDNFTLQSEKAKRAMAKLQRDITGPQWVRFKLGKEMRLGTLVRTVGDLVVARLPETGEELTFPAADVMAMGRMNPAEQGFMLMEVMFTIALVSMSIVVLLSALMTGFVMTRMNRDAKQAVQILVDRTESLRLVNFVLLDRVPTTFTQDIGGVHYDGQVIVSPATMITSSYSNELRHVTVRVDWKTGNLARHREFDTLIANNGLQAYVY